jgi:hypothetical protein
MTEQAAQLYQLQTMDLNLAKRRLRLKEIAALLADDARVNESRAALTAAEDALKPWQVRSRTLDLEIKGLADKIKTTTERLYSGKVRNTKEMQEMQDEIASLERRRGHLEDDLIEAMLRIEEAQAAVDAARTTFDTVTVTMAGEKHDLKGEQDRLTAEMHKLEAMRKAAAQTVDPAALQKYEALRTAKKGQAVSVMVGESCKSCGVEQTSAIVQQVHQSHALVCCWSCGRILTMDPR